MQLGDCYMVLYLPNNNTRESKKGLWVTAGLRALTSQKNNPKFTESKQKQKGHSKTTCTGSKQSQNMEAAAEKKNSSNRTEKPKRDPEDCSPF